MKLFETKKRIFKTVFFLVEYIYFVPTIRFCKVADCGIDLDFIWLNAYFCLCAENKRNRKIEKGGVE